MIAPLCIQVKSPSSKFSVHFLLSSVIMQKLITLLQPSVVHWNDSKLCILNYPTRRSRKFTNMRSFLFSVEIAESWNHKLRKHFSNNGMVYGMAYSTFRMWLYVVEQIFLPSWFLKLQSVTAKDCVAFLLSIPNPLLLHHHNHHRNKVHLRTHLRNSTPHGHFLAL